MKTKNELKKQIEAWIDEGRCIATLMIPGGHTVTGVVVDMNAATVTLQEADRDGVVFRAYPWHNVYRIEYGLSNEAKE
jgi:hypothetical protein